jgi:hypothetical protein
MRLESNVSLPAAGVVVLAIAMAACGSSSNGSSGTATSAPETAASSAANVASPALLHACDLLTPAIARKLIGAAAQQTMRAQPNPHMTHCHYRSGTGSVDVMVGDRWDFINVGQEHVPGEKPLTGLGDEAYINSVTLRVRKGTHGMEITATGPGGTYTGAAADAETAHGQALEIKTAKVLLPRL